MADDSEKQEQADIEQLLGEVEGGEAPSTDSQAASPEQDAASLAQDEIQSLLQSAESSSAAGATAPPVSAESAASDGYEMAGDDLQVLLEQATAAIDSVDGPVEPIPPGVAPFEWTDLPGTPVSTEQATLDLIRDVELDLKIELGRTLMYLEDVLKLRKGSVVPLDKLAGDPVDVFVNGRLIARGEVLVLNDNFCVRVAELTTGDATTAN